MREYLKNNQGNSKKGNKTQSSLVSSPDRAAYRGAISSEGGGGNHLYVITSLQEQKDSPDVVTGIIRVFDFTVYALLDQGASLSFLNPYIGINFDIISQKLTETFNVFPPVGEPIVA